MIEVLPLLKHYEEDSAPYITTGIINAVDPETGIVGRGIHRMEWRGENRLGIAILNPPLSEILEKYKGLSQKMPVSIVIGVDPLLFLSMALKVPSNIDKLEVAAALKGGEIEVISSFDSGIEIPKGGEFVLEGVCDPEETKIDGPFGEVSGYYLTIKETPTVTINKIYERPSPFYHALLPYSFEADSYLTFVSQAHIEGQAKGIFPFLKELYFIERTFGSSVVVKVRPVEREAVKNLIIFFLSFPMIKKVVVVEEDVDIYDLREIEWAIVTRCFGGEDIVIVEGLKGQPIDPQSKGKFAVTKIGINATSFGKEMEKRVRVTRGHKERVRKILESLGV